MNEVIDEIWTCAQFIIEHEQQLTSDDRRRIRNLISTLGAIEQDGHETTH